MKVFKTGFVELPSGVITDGYFDKDGYKYVNIRKENGQKTSAKIHRLVAEKFIPNPESKPCVNHIDGNKENNNVDNLEWVTYSENMKHAVETGLVVNCTFTGEDHNAAKHSDKEIQEMRDKYSTGNYTMRQLAKEYKTSSGYVSDVINLKRRVR